MLLYTFRHRAEEKPRQASGEANAAIASTCALLLFDGTCGLCSGAVDWLRARAGASGICAVPNQAPGVLESVGISRAEADRSVWILEPDGSRHEAAAAVNRILRDLRGLWPLLALLYSVRPVRELEDLLYDWVARHRGHLAFLGAVPACRRSSVVCARGEEEGGPR